MKKNLPVTGVQQVLRDEQVIISTTDKKGLITSVQVIKQFQREW